MLALLGGARSIIIQYYLFGNVLPRFGIAYLVPNPFEFLPTIVINTPLTLLKLIASYYSWAGILILEGKLIVGGGLFITKPLNMQLPTGAGRNSKWRKEWRNGRIAEWHYSNNLHIAILCHHMTPTCRSCW